MTHTQARATIRRYYLYAFVGSLQFTWTTWLAFVLARGGNPGWAESAYHLAILLGEVPTGAVADLLGRRFSMMIGLGLSLVAALGHLWIHDTFTAVLFVGLSGFATTFHSGASQALLYETAEVVGGTDYARKALARANALQLAALAVAPAIAGFLYQWRDWSPFIAKAIMVSVTFLIVRGMVEKQSVAPSEGRRTVWGQTGAAVRTVLANRPVAIMVLFGWVYNTALAMTGQYGQAYFPYTGLAMGITGIVFAVGTSASSGGSALAERVSATGAGRLLRFAPVFAGLGILGMGFFGLHGMAIMGVAAYLIAASADGLMYPVFEAKLNQAIPNDQRATILSIQNAGFSMFMSMTFPAASYLSPIPMIYVVTGAVSLGLALIWMLRRWQY